MARSTARGIRDMDIGEPTAENLTRPTEVQNFANVIASTDATTHGLDEATEELKKVRTGIGLVVGQEIEEAE